MSTTKNNMVFADGEGLTYGDLNTLEDLRVVGTYDYAISPFTQSLAGEINAAFGVVYAARGGAAYVKPGASANQIGNTAGVIYLATGASVDGVDQTVYPYVLGTDELLATVTPDTTSPRWVGLYIRLDLVNAATENRDFQDAVTGVVTTSPTVPSEVVQLTKSVVHGTPASSPSIPATPFGYSPYAYVYVPANNASVFSFADLVDCRYPIGVRSVFVGYKQLNRFIGTWTANDTVGAMDSSGTGTFFIHAFVGVPATSRILSATWYTSGGTFSTNPKVFSARSRLPSLDVAPIAAASGTGVMRADFTASITHGRDLAADPDVGITGPVWGNGSRHPQLTTAFIAGSEMTFVLTSGTVEVYGVRFDIAG